MACKSRGFNSPRVHTFGYVNLSASSLDFARDSAAKLKGNLKEKIAKVSQLTIGNETPKVLKDIERAIKEKDRNALLLYRLRKDIFSKSRGSAEGNKNP